MELPGRDPTEEDAEKRPAAAHRAIRIREKRMGPFPSLYAVPATECIHTLTPCGERG